MQPMDKYKMSLQAIVDLDGTLSDSAHRQHFMTGKKKDWMAFYEALVDDEPNWDILWIVENWALQNVPILLATGRPEEYRLITCQWLEKYHVPFRQLYMRKTKDYRSDDIVKLELLEQMRADGYNPNIALDDRDRVVRAWRSVGIRCLQVADGAF